MSRATLIVLAIVSNVFFPISKIDAHPTVKNISILDEIKSDAEICQTRRVFSESRYAKSCQEVNFPLNKSEIFDQKHAQQFLCLGFYQKIWQLCFLSSVSKLTNKDLPENATMFDTTVEKYINSTNVETLCNNWNYADPSKYGKIKDYVVQLENMLNNSVTCLKLCSTFHVVVEPLCAVLASMDEISHKLQTETKRFEASGREGISQDAEKKGSQNADPEPAQKEVSAGKTESKIIKGSQIAINGTKATPQKIVEHVKPKPKQQTTSTLTSEKKPTEPESKKPETNQPVDTKTHMVNEPKEAPVAKENANKVVQDLSKPVIVDKKKDKPTSPKNTQVNPPQSGEDQAPAHDNSQEDLDKNPAGVEQEDDNTDVISQHTQDDDITVERRPSEDVNEIESPIQPTQEEDANENPAQAPENYSFVPRLPGIRDDDDSHFFGYFTVIGVICIAGYVGYHNKQKILAMVLEGRRSRGGRGRRRPSTANYRKLDCTLEEAVTSQCNSNVTHVIY